MVVLVLVLAPILETLQVQLQVKVKVEEVDEEACQLLDPLRRLLTQLGLAPRRLLKPPYLIVPYTLHILLLRHLFQTLPFLLCLLNPILVHLTDNAHDNILGNRTSLPPPLTRTNSNINDDMSILSTEAIKTIQARMRSTTWILLVVIEAGARLARHLAILHQQPSRQQFERPL